MNESIYLFPDSSLGPYYGGGSGGRGILDFNPDPGRGLL